ncbi:YggS family pyridoxal phosphate-dependent enzyme [Acidihalobacter prosperus]|uniref:Pyridoxal phosphate homeostasis protein n=1 Tax=Acidihalobacter prosperus TaxID=160660 RepID=A0A1A6C0R1_9GAMM|nr:YggS family pyridoxal phosphate-dependent enzyme [Acidihalobacter prosperus]OBS08145.1 YggS family pyridoxal phosphate enzyme [Acidihalobacter prosperus]
MSDICPRIEAVRIRIRRAALAAGRDPRGIALLAVGKTFPAEAIRAAHGCGQRVFGENYVDELVAKAATLADLDIEWHFIGQLQSNKTRKIAAVADWVHGIDRLSVAERLDRQRPTDRPPLQVCLQVNISGETSKAGVAPEALPALAHAVSALPRLRLRGLMALPAPSDDPRVQHAGFAAVRILRDALADDGLALDTLSMGMSGDLDAAVAEGATLVRVGTAVFGARKPRLPSP